MKSKNKVTPIIFAVVLLFSVIASLTFCSCSHPFPYQGSLNGNWSGQLTVLTRNVPVGGTISIAIDAKGAGTGTVTVSGSGAASAKIEAQVDPNGNLSGTVSFTISGTNFVSDWKGKVTSSGNSLSVQGTWTSQHGSGTFSGTGTSSK